MASGSRQVVDESVMSKEKDWDCDSGEVRAAICRWHTGISPIIGSFLIIWAQFCPRLAWSGGYAGRSLSRVETGLAAGMIQVKSLS